MQPPWSVYEDAARKVLADLRQILGVSAIEGKQLLDGISGTNWELDAKAWCEGSGGFLFIEVRRYTTAGLKQEDLAAVAYRIRDVGSSGGIIVSPLPIAERRSACCRKRKYIACSPSSRY